MFDPATGSGSFECYFEDDDDDPPVTQVAPSQVYLEITDDDGDTGIDFINVLVRNVDPEADLGGDRFVNEGDLVSFAAIVTDQSPADTFPGTFWEADCSYGPPVNGAAPEPLFEFAFTAIDNGVCNITFQVSDDDGGTGTAFAIVTVSNLAPVLGAVAIASPIDEDGVATLSGTITDPGSADTFTLDVDWGDGSAVETFTYPAGATSFSETHQYLDDDPTGTPSDSYSVQLTAVRRRRRLRHRLDVGNCNNLPPSLSAPIFNFNPITGVASASIVISDPGSLDTHTAVFHWGDGTSSTGTIASGVASSGNHTYSVGCAAAAPYCRRHG